MNNQMHLLRRGKHYVFNFTHKKNVHGIVCEINLDREFFVVYDVNTKDYESIPQRRFINFEQR